MFKNYKESLCNKKIISKSKRPIQKSTEATGELISNKIDAIKIASKRAIQKTTKATGDLTSNKTAEKITGKASPKDVSI